MNNQKAARVILILIFIAGACVDLLSQDKDYEQIFGSDWQKANTFLEDNNNWIKPALEKYNIPYDEAIAVIFPELVRYSALRDKMEISLLKTLYRNLGNDYSDFSVGVFQVKPSFAERIRKELPKVMGNHSEELFKKRSFYKDDHEYRASIISSLEDPVTELNYIIAFFKICLDRFQIDFTDESATVMFLATAYNTGFWKSRKEIEMMSDKQFFSTKLIKTETYSYSDISLYWYHKCLRKTDY